MSRPLAARKRAKDARLRREYGITLSERQQVLYGQNKRCAICGHREDEFNVPFAVDHDHKTGELRGLLCWKCNRAIGAFQRFHPNAVELFMAAGKYFAESTFTKFLGRVVITAPGKVGSKKRRKLLDKIKQESNGKP